MDTLISCVLVIDTGDIIGGGRVGGTTGISGEELVLLAYEISLVLDVA